MQWSHLREWHKLFVSLRWAFTQEPLHWIWSVISDFKEEKKVTGHKRKSWNYLHAFMHVQPNITIGKHQFSLRPPKTDGLVDLIWKKMIHYDAFIIITFHLFFIAK